MYIHRLLKIIELPTLDSILSYDAVDGKIISYNIIKSLQQLETVERGEYIPMNLLWSVYC